MKQYVFTKTTQYYMKFRDYKIRRFIAHLRLFLDDIDIYDVETANCARDSTIYINGYHNGEYVTMSILRLKFAPAQLILRDASYHNGKINELWHKCVD